MPSNQGRAYCLSLKDCYHLRIHDCQWPGKAQVQKGKQHGAKNLQGKESVKSQNS